MKSYILDNGIRVALVPLVGLKAVTVEVGVKIGAKYENQEEAGISHFLEHMAFAGTGKRKGPAAVFNEIDARGAGGNAETDLEMTSYYLTTVLTNLEWAVELLADIMFDPLFGQAELDKEKGVVIEEIRMYEDNPMMGLSGKFFKEMWKQSNVGCFNVSGGVEDIDKITRHNLVKYRDKYLDPKRMVVVVSGNIGPENQVMGWLGKYWGKFTNNQAIELPELGLIWTKPQKITMKKPELEQGHFCVGVPGITRMDRQRYSMRLLDILLSGNTSSKLFDEIRTRRGWAYYVFSISQNLGEGGLIGIQSGVRLDKMEEAMELAMTVMTDTRQINQTEIDRARSYLLGKIELSRDRSEFWSKLMCERWLLDNQLVDIDQEIESYQKVTLQDVLIVADKYLKREEMRIMAVSR